VAVWVGVVLVQGHRLRACRRRHHRSSCSTNSWDECATCGNICDSSCWDWATVGGWWVADRWVAYWWVAHLWVCWWVVHWWEVDLWVVDW